MVGDEIRFEAVSVEQAQQWLRQEEEALEKAAKAWQTRPSFWKRLLGAR